MKPSETIAVQKIVLNLNGKHVELTPDEARKLRSELDSLLWPVVQICPQIIYQQPYLPQPLIPWYSTCTAVGAGNRFETSGYLQVTN